MKDKTVTIKIWDKTRKKLKILAAQEDKPMTVLLEEIVSELIVRSNQRAP